MVGALPTCPALFLQLFRCYTKPGSKTTPHHVHVTMTAIHVITGQLRHRRSRSEAKPSADGILAALALWWNRSMLI